MTVDAAGECMTIVLVGFARLSVAAPQGRQVEVALLHEGGAVGVSFNEPQSPNLVLEAVSAVRLMRTGRSILTRVASRHSALVRAVADEASRQLSSAVYGLVHRSVAPVRERPAAELLERSRHTTLACSHQDLADSIGSAREVVSRVLAELRRQGVVQTYRGRLVITNPSVLSRLAGASETARHLGRLPPAVPLIDPGIYAGHTFATPDSPRNEAHDGGGSQVATK